LLSRIKVLQLGDRDWSQCYQLPDYIDFHYFNFYNTDSTLPYDIVFVEKTLSYIELQLLFKVTKAYTLFVVGTNLEFDHAMQEYFNSKKGKYIDKKDIQRFLLCEVRNFFSDSYGEKFKFKNLSIAQNFEGSIEFDGNYSVILNGDFGEKLSQIAFWKNNIPVFEGQAIELWLEYLKDAGVEIALEVIQFRAGTVSEVQQKWFFTENDLKDIVVIDNEMPTGPIFVSLMAKGAGKLQIIALHDRYSRRGYGMFLPGGERYVTKDREEIFYYFDPGDMKPPLNVYFSGYKTRQGFEGYYMMRKMKCPFLLIAEPRLEGGSFYMGSDEYEKAIENIIRKHMNELGFSNEQVIMSGLSMGTYGALYYGCDILPHAMILGKPLASIGDVAANERLHRPGGFPTSLDVLNYLIGDTDEGSIRKLNNRFWNKFDSTKWKNNKFVISYMIEDDYDAKAYDMIISSLNADGVQVYGKGIHGRHNDATNVIVNWFKSQYDKILSEDFSRGD